MDSLLYLPDYRSFIRHGYVWILLIARMNVFLMFFFYFHFSIIIFLILSIETFSPQTLLILNAIRFYKQIP